MGAETELPTPPPGWGQGRGAGLMYVACWPGSMVLTSAAVAVSISTVWTVMVVLVVVVVLAAWNTGDGSSRVVATWGATGASGRQVREQLDFPQEGEWRPCVLFLMFGNPYTFFWSQQAIALLRIRTSHRLITLAPERCASVTYMELIEICLPRR